MENNRQWCFQSKQVSDKNFAIEFYRIFFTVIICMHHLQWQIDAPLMKRGYLGVEFFFALSGYFLYRSFIRETQHSLSGYIQKRVLRLYPEYIVALLPFLLLSIVKGDFSFSRFLPEVFMIQNSGIFTSTGYNYPCWYVSVLVVGGILLYQALTAIEKNYVRLWGAIFVLMTYIYLFESGSGLENWDSVGPFYLPLIRGIAGITVGILIAAIGAPKRNNIVLGSIAEISSVILLLIAIFTDNLDERIALIAIVVLVYVTIYRQGILSRCLNFKVFGFWGTIAYPMYLNQAIFIIAIEKLSKMIDLPSEYMWYAIMIAGLFVYSFIIHSLVNFKLKKSSATKNK